METKPILGFWRCRGLGDSVRLLFRYLNVDFEDRIYTQGPGPDYDRSEWNNDIPLLEMSFPNLPYLIDGSFKISETLAILEYIASKYKPELAGSGLQEQSTIRQLGGVIISIRFWVGGCCHSPNFNADEVVKYVTPEIQGLVKFLGEKKFLLGENLCWPEFLMVELLDMIDEIKPGTIQGISDKLVEYWQRLKNLEGVREYVNQPRLPWNNTHAYWGTTIL